ncbi:MAG: hypothetical protein ACK5LO_09670 [Leucobacter sp.]
MPQRDGDGDGCSSGGRARVSRHLGSHPRADSHEEQPEHGHRNRRDGERSERQQASKLRDGPCRAEHDREPQQRPAPRGEHERQGARRSRVTVTVRLRP